VLVYGLDDRGFESRLKMGIFLFTASRPALGITQPPIQWEFVELYLYSLNTPFMA
jgi:hypothetical protein